MSDRTERPARRVPGPRPTTPGSPCVGLCRIDEADGLCAGCARRLDEIAAWGTMAEEARRRVWAALPGRRAASRVPAHAPPASPDDEPRHAS